MGKNIHTCIYMYMYMYISHELYHIKYIYKTYEYIHTHIFSTLPTAVRCLTFGQKWRSIELCRSDRNILSNRNEESKAGTTID